MSIPTEKNGQLITTSRAEIAKRPATIKDILMSEAMRSALKMALPQHVKADRMARVALTALTRNPKLAECTQDSFFGSLLSAAQLGLEPNTPLGLAYLIPYGRECTLVVGYQGMIDISSRSGTHIRGNVVREGDRFEVAYGLEQKLIHVPSDDPDRDERPVVKVYAIANLPGPSREPVFTVLSRAQVEKFRKRSKSANSGPWVTDWEAMALKTAVRRLFTWLPKSVEIATAIALDEAPELGEQRAAYDSSVVDAVGSLNLQLEAPGEQVQHEETAA